MCIVSPAGHQSKTDHVICNQYVQRHDSCMKQTQHALVMYRSIFQERIIIMKIKKGITQIVLQEKQ